MSAYVLRHYRYNFAVNVLDGGFFVFGVGFASWVTVFPLFVSHLTDSALLIGLIPAVHTVFWQLPQVFTARAVASRARLKPAVVTLTIVERPDCTIRRMVPRQPGVWHFSPARS